MRKSARGRLMFWVRWLAFAATGLVFVAGGLVAAWVVWTVHDLPFMEIRPSEVEPAILLKASDGSPVEANGPRRGLPVERSEIPPHVVNALLAIEDRRFYAHPGIDPVGIARAFYRNSRAGTIEQGASTITQQLVRANYLDDAQTLHRKVREAVLAVWLEMTASKDDILTAYLNTVYFGSGTYGIRAASRYYFDKAPAGLTVAEAAILAGLIRAPSLLNPHDASRASRRRALQVIDAMVETGTLSPAQAARARSTLAGESLFAGRGDGVIAGSWHGDWIRTQAEPLAVAAPGARAVRVNTTFDPRLQAYAQDLVAAFVRNKGFARFADQAALVAMRPDGAVLAMVGGADYADSQFNRATQAHRQPGSLFKLFVYYAALRDGRRPGDAVDDRPLRIGRWRPQNFDGSFAGRMTLQAAFARSRNIPAIRLARDLGYERVVAAARDLGFRSRIGNVPSLALGVSTTTLLEITAAYASILSGRTPVQPWAIRSLEVDGEETMVGPPPTAAARRIPPAQREAMIGMLRRVVVRGTGRRAAIDDLFVAGKTGTSQNYRDAWFVGFTRDLVVGVWIGNDDNRPMERVTGGLLPAQIWRHFVAYAEGRETDFQALAAAGRPFEPAQCGFGIYDGTGYACVATTEGQDAVENDAIHGTRGLAANILPAAEPSQPGRGGEMDSVDGRSGGIFPSFGTSDAER